MSITELIKAHEGLRLKAYKCTAGYTTIGYGRNLDTNGISEIEAEAMLQQDITECRRWLAEVIPWSTQLDPARSAALTDLRYNLGATKLLGFRKFLAAMSRGDWSRAAQELRESIWYGQVGRRAPRITGMIETGEWP